MNIIPFTPFSEHQRTGETPSQWGKTPTAFGSQTPMVGSTTPSYGSMTPMHGGGRTPMYGFQTPLHDGEGGGEGRGCVDDVPTVYIIFAKLCLTRLLPLPHR